MSQAPSTKLSTYVTSSSFQSIFDAALQSYQEKTKKDLIAHPLVTQLEACGSTSDILAILQGQARALDKSRSSDETLTKWLSPTVNVLCTFSVAVSGGVSLVGLNM